MNSYMNYPDMSYPIGVIGAFANADIYIKNQLNETDDIMILDSKANIDDIKDFRKFLMHRGFNRRVGIIHAINKWKVSEQAVLLKIFEQMPEFNLVFYTASFLPSIVIQTRSKIIRVSSSKDEKLQELMSRLVSAMQNGTYVRDLMDGFKIAVLVQSWVDDGVIGPKEQTVILRSIGIKE